MQKVFGLIERLSDSFHAVLDGAQVVNDRQNLDSVPGIPAKIEDLGTPAVNPTVIIRFGHHEVSGESGGKTSVTAI